jgi:hypothetical protein
MKRLYVWIAALVTGAMLLTACGGGGTNPNSGTGDVKPGASGIKDAALIGKWVTADGGGVYEFKDDFTVSIQVVGAIVTVPYDIREGGKGEGKVAIAETAGNVIWTYKITGEKLDLTTPEGRAKRLSKSS